MIGPGYARATRPVTPRPIPCIRKYSIGDNVTRCNVITGESATFRRS